MSKFIQVNHPIWIMIYGRLPPALQIFPLLAQSSLTTQREVAFAAGIFQAYVTVHHSS